MEIRSGLVSLRRAPYWKSLFAIGIVVPINPALACIAVESGSFSPAILIIFLIAGLAGSLMLGAVVWGIIKVVLGRERLFHTLAISGLLISILLAAVGAFVVPRFKELFDAVGADLPLQTTILMSDHQFLWLPFVLFLPLWYSIRHSANRARYVGGALLIEASLLSLVFWALYSPVFKMGNPC